MPLDFVRKLPDGSVQQKAPELWNRIHIDPLLMLLVYATLAYGLSVLYSASDGQIGYVKRQLVYAGLGSVAMLVIAQIPLAFVQRWVWLMFLGGVGMLIGVMFFGTTVNGAKRWLDLGVIAFQPSEVIKLALPLTLAAYLGRRQLPPSLKHIFFSLIIVAIPAALIVVQPDLGTSLLVVCSGLVVLFVSGVKWRYWFGAGLLALGTAPLVWQFALHDYQRGRILTLFNPEADRLGSGWNIIQSMIAIGSGGMEGKGWLGGTQSQLDFLPESHTDFIIAVLAEEMGFRGVALLLVLYFCILARGLWISYQAKTPFSRLASAALVVTLFIYIFVNMAMVSGLLPVVGVPLPLVSYGGTSLLSLFMAFGILMAVATEEPRLNR